MAHLAVFIFLMMCTIYGSECKLAKKLFVKKNLNVPFAKLSSKQFFQHFGVFLMPFHFGPLIKFTKEQETFA